jgi:hypothetical protein
MSTCSGARTCGPEPSGVIPDDLPFDLTKIGEVVEQHNVRYVVIGGMSAAEALRIERPRALPVLSLLGRTLPVQLPKVGLLLLSPVFRAMVDHPWNVPDWW